MASVEIYLSVQTVFVSLVCFMSISVTGTHTTVLFFVSGNIGTVQWGLSVGNWNSRFLVTKIQSVASVVPNSDRGITRIQQIYSRQVSLSWDFGQGSKSFWAFWGPIALSCEQHHYMQR